ncbi:hypothetical protein PUN28_001856 [Cardiocondyla obscurior]
MIGFFWSDQDAGSDIEYLTHFTGPSLAITKSLCLFVNQEKLGMNINAAIDDWISVEDNEKAKRIMKKYATRARILTFTLLYSVFGCFFAYISVILFINVKQIFFTDKNLADGNVTQWMFIFPIGSLSNLINRKQYTMIMTFQAVEVFIQSLILCVSDCLFFSVTMHLSGQINVLKNKIAVFAHKPDTETNYQKKFVELLNRHSELTKLYHNLEDSFNIYILIELVMNTIMLAFIGLRINICLNKKYYAEAIKSTCIANYILINSLIFTYGGEFLQQDSEDIFHALYAASWYTLPLALMKDIQFTMMKSNIPFRLTGGKFFFVNRETMMNILKTAASYVSVLRIAIEKYDDQ